MGVVSCVAPLSALRRAVFGMLVVVGLGGCAAAPGAHPRDPLEKFNRDVFVFNEAADRLALRPAAIAYRDMVPSPLRYGITNFFGNLEDVWSFANSAMQLRLQSATDNFMRVSINTVLGLGGTFDLAKGMGIERRREDFGQTLGRWGVPTGPYLVLPLLGPSTLRDTLGLVVDMRGDIASYIDHVPTRNTLKAIDLIDLRAGLLSVTNALDEVALDKYSFARDAFLQRRRNAVFDGDPPEEDAEGKPVTR